MVDEEMKEEVKKEEPVAKPANELEDCKAKCDEYLNNWKRAAADMINYKKEEMERMAMLGNYAKENMIYKILPIFDGFYMAEKQMGDELKKDGWATGFLQIQKQIEDFLKKEGVEEIVAIGQKFDPGTMEIVEEVSGAPTPIESGIVMEALQKGYKIGEKILRPAKVRVGK